MFNETRINDSHKTVRRSDHVLVGDDRSSAEKHSSRVPQRRHPRIFVFPDFGAADDPRSRISNAARYIWRNIRKKR